MKEQMLSIGASVDKDVGDEADIDPKTQTPAKRVDSRTTVSTQPTHPAPQHM